MFLRNIRTSVESFFSKKAEAQVIEQNVDLSQYPHLTSEHPSNKNNQLTIGDLHGNALKLIYFLIYQNVLVLKNKEKDYKELVDIFMKDIKKMTPLDVARFKQILAQSNIRDVGVVRLLGDELADRAGIDYLTLEVIAAMHEKGVNLEILMSNHALEFIEAYERCEANKNNIKEFRSDRILKSQTQSLELTRQLLENKVIEWKALHELMEKHYKPCQKLLSYSIDNNCITLYSHAPVGIDRPDKEIIDKPFYYSLAMKLGYEFKPKKKLSLIPALAQKLGVPYKDNTVLELANTIDAINKVYLNDYVLKNKVHTLYEADIEFEKATQGSNPVIFLAWNREYDKIIRSEIHPNGKYLIKFVHGHDSSEITHANIVNLDNNLGKRFRADVKGKYFVLFSQETSAPKLQVEDHKKMNLDMKHG
jgi:hypothetical protein